VSFGTLTGSAPGTVLAGSWRPSTDGPRGASHGSASPHDMRNSLFAWSPRFKRSLRSTIPAGTVDVAPTVRHLLGLPQPDADGRILTEALALARVAHPTYVVQAQARRTERDSTKTGR